MFARIRLWDTTGTDRARGNLQAIIDDAANVGVETLANAAGKCFFTLPYDHPQIGQCLPKLRHYRISRVSDDGTTETTVGVGLLDDFDANENDVVFYGIDYVGLFDRSISAQNTTYTSQFVGNIIQAEATLARNQTGTPNPNSVLGFLAIGSFDATTLQLPTVLTSYQPRLQFIQSLVNTWKANNTYRPLFSVTRDPPFTVSFVANAGSDQTDLSLEWGGNVDHFDYKPGWNTYRTEEYAIGQKRDGATLIYDNEVVGDEATYGISQHADVFIDVVDATQLKNMTLHTARVMARIGKSVALTISPGGLIPWDGFDLADSIPVTISRGIVSLSRALYTIDGLTWQVAPNGAESTGLLMNPKDV